MSQSQRVKTGAPIPVDSKLRCRSLFSKSQVSAVSCTKLLAEMVVAGSRPQKISSATGKFQSVSRCPMVTCSEPRGTSHESPESPHCELSHVASVPNTAPVRQAFAAPQEVSRGPQRNVENVENVPCGSVAQHGMSQTVEV